MKDVFNLSEEKIQLNNVSNLKGLETIDFSGGFICDVETGICGPAEKKEVNEEKKNENNHMV